jgi:RNA polymerase sigma-70 factor (ECF subfamily)
MAISIVAPGALCKCDNAGRTFVPTPRHAYTLAHDVFESPLVPHADASETSLALLERARHGDQSALEALLGRYLPRLRRWARGRLPVSARDLADTDDLVQETLVSVVRRVAGFEPRGDGAFELYVRQALWNRIRDEIRAAARRRGRMDADEHLVDPAPSPVALAVGREALERYERALESLSEEEREAIVGRFELGYDYRELARALGKFTPDAARKTVERAIAHLARQMAQ